MTLPASPVVRHVLLTPSTLTLQVDSTGPVTARTTDSTGVSVTAQQVTWSSSNTTVAIAGTDETMTPISTGDAIVTASISGVSGIASVQVIPVAVRHFAIVDAQFTQGVQSADGSIPIVLLNKSTVVNVLVKATAETITPIMQIALNFFDANNQLIRSDTFALPLSNSDGVRTLRNAAIVNQHPLQRKNPLTSRGSQGISIRCRR